MENQEPRLFKNKYSTKFYVGIVLIVLSLVIGKITLATFIIYFNDDTIKLVSLIIYILSWPMLLLGVWWVGKEYADKVKRYFQYRYYHQHLVKGTKKAFQLTKKHTQYFKQNTIDAFAKTKERTDSVANKFKPWKK